MIEFSYLSNNSLSIIKEKFYQKKFVSCMINTQEFPSIQFNQFINKL